MKNNKLEQFDSREKTRMIVEAGIMIALATALSYVKLFEMGQGGSVTAASMVPIFLFAYRWGGKFGLLVGVVYGIIQFIVDPFASSPVAILLDYPLAFGILGVAGFIAYRAEKYYKLVVGIMVGVFGRYVFHVISGVAFYYMYAGEMNPLKYSILYNSFLLAELLITVVVTTLLFPVLKKIKN